MGIWRQPEELLNRWESGAEFKNRLTGGIMKNYLTGGNLKDYLTGGKVGGRVST